MTQVFLDTETVGLAPDADVWEIGAIVRGHQRQEYDGEWLWQVRPNLYNAEPGALKISKFYERFRLDADQLRCDAAMIETPLAGQSMKQMSPESVARLLCLLMDGAMWIGAVPGFDELRMGRFVRQNGYALSNHYQLIDVEALAAGYIAGRQSMGDPIDFEPMPPWNSRALTAVIGAEQSEDETHTALGDARWAMKVWDVVFGRRSCA